MTGFVNSFASLLTILASLRLGPLGRPQQLPESSHAPENLKAIPATTLARLFESHLSNEARASTYGQDRCKEVPTVRTDARKYLHRVRRLFILGALSACLLGLALGQVIAGPISNALGRRHPLLVGLIAYALASLLCVVVPSVFVLVALRFVQDFAEAVSIVIARAVVRTLHSGFAVCRCLKSWLRPA